MEKLQAILTIEWLILALLVAALGDKLKPLANFILRMCGRKPMNGGPHWLTKEDYNNRRPEWFDAWETRHNEIHDKIGGSIKEVGVDLKEARKELGELSKTVVRIDERTKKD